MHAVLCAGEMLGHGFGQASRWDLANAWLDNNQPGNDHGLFNNTAGSANPEESAFHQDNFELLSRRGRRFALWWTIRNDALILGIFFRDSIGRITVQTGNY